MDLYAINKERKKIPLPGPPEVGNPNWFHIRKLQIFYLDSEKSVQKHILLCSTPLQPP